MLRLPWLYQERRWHPDLSRFGPFAAPVAGVAFGFGWTPCIGPVLGSVLAVAGTQGSTAHGAALLTAYSAGLGLPFLATGLLYGWVVGALVWVRRHSTGLMVTSAVTMAAFGLLLTLADLGHQPAASGAAARRARTSRVSRLKGAAVPSRPRRRRRFRDKWLTIALASVVVALVAIIAAVVTAHDANTAPSARAAGYRTDPQDWRLPALSGGGTVALDQFRGRPTVVNFFASWCSACDFELPGFARVSRELQGQVNFLGVDALETGDPTFMPRRHGTTW